MSEEPDSSEGTRPSQPGNSNHVPRSPGSRTRQLIPAVIAVVVAALVVLVYILLVPPSGNSSSGGEPLTFSEAREEANATAAGHGSWTLGYVAGYNVPTPSVLNVSSLTSIPTCAVKSFVGPISGNVTVPAFQGNLTTGSAMEWQFFYYQPTDSNEFGVIEIDGSVSVAFEWTGTNCTAGQQLWMGHPIMGNPIDSSSAVAAAMAAGGLSFLRAHPSGVSEWMLMQGGGGWVLGWTSCYLWPDAAGWIGEGGTFQAFVNATTGAILPNSTYDRSCGGPPPIGDALSFGTPTLALETNPGYLPSQGCGARNYCYTVPITKAGYNVTADNLSLGIYVNNSGLNYVVGYSILNASGTVLVYSFGASTGSGGGTWESGSGSGTTPLSRGMNLTVDMGVASPSGLGCVLVVEGYGAGFANSPYFATPLP